MTERPLRAVPDPADGPEPLMRDLIGAVLRRARTEQGRTLQEVAATARISLPYLSEIERGRKEPSSEVLAAVCRALNLRLINLVGDLHSELAVVSPTPRQAPAAPPQGPQAMLLAA